LKACKAVVQQLRELVGAPNLRSLRTSKYSMAKAVLSNLTAEQQSMLRECLRDLRKCCEQAGVGDAAAAGDVVGVQKVLLELIMLPAQASA
jgi:hypothetical protein